MSHQSGPKILCFDTSCCKISPYRLRNILLILQISPAHSWHQALSLSRTPCPRSWPWPGPPARCGCYSKCCETLHGGCLRFPPNWLVLELDMRVRKHWEYSCFTVRTLKKSGSSLIIWSCRLCIVSALSRESEREKKKHYSNPRRHVLSRAHAGVFFW